MTELSSGSRDYDAQQHSVLIWWGCKSVPEKCSEKKKKAEIFSSSGVSAGLLERERESDRGREREQGRAVRRSLPGWGPSLDGNTSWNIPGTSQRTTHHFSHSLPLSLSYGHTNRGNKRWAYEIKSLPSEKKELLSPTPFASFLGGDISERHALRLSHGDLTVAATRKYQRECAKVTAETHFLKNTHTATPWTSEGYWKTDLQVNFYAPEPSRRAQSSLDASRRTHAENRPSRRRNHTIAPIRASTFTASYPPTLTPSLHPSRSASLSLPLPRPCSQPGRAGYCKFLRILRNPGNLHAMQCVPGVFPLHSLALIS